jgi:hypothetical protein
MTERTRRKKVASLRRGLAALVLAVAVGQAGCSGGSKNGSPPGGSPSGGTEPSEATKLEAVKEDLARTRAKHIENALQLYHVRNAVYPPTLAELTRKDAAGGGPYLPAETLSDPWGKEYQYAPAGPHHKAEKPDVWTTTPGGKTIGNFKE